MAEATPSREPGSLPRAERTGLPEALRTLRRLVAEGAVEIDTPLPGGGERPRLRARTVIQLDGDVVTFVSSDAPDATLELHFRRVRDRLAALAALRARALRLLLALPAAVWLWNGGAIALDAVQGDRISLAAAVPHLWWLGGSLLFGLLAPLLVKAGLRLALRRALAQLPTAGG